MSTTLVLTHHPVSNPRIKISKPIDLWDEIAEYANSYTRIIDNASTTPHVHIESWALDFDRHPQEQTGIAVYIIVVTLMCVLDAFGIVPEALRANLETLCVRMRTAFSTNDSTVRDMIQEHLVDIKTLEQLYVSHKDVFANTWGGFHYRFPTKLLDSPEGHDKIHERLKEIRLCGVDTVRRIILADFARDEDFDKAASILEKEGVDTRKLVPLIEDRMQCTEQLFLKDFELIQLAGSDTMRRIGMAGLIHLIISVSKHIVETGGRQSIFVGQGNTNHRSAMISSIIPSMIPVETTSQGEIVRSLAEPTFFEDYIAHYNRMNDSNHRPSFNEMLDVSEFYSVLDQSQMRLFEANKNIHLFKAAKLNDILATQFIFGSRFKKKHFSEDISENDLLTQTRAITHAWVYQLTGAVPLEIREIYHFIQHDEYRRTFIAKRSNPYIRFMMQNAIKSTLNCDAALAKEYYSNSNIHTEHFEMLYAVTRFLVEYFNDDYEERFELLRLELNKFKLSQNEFVDCWQRFRKFRYELVDASNPLELLTSFYSDETMPYFETGRC